VAARKISAQGEMHCGQDLTFIEMRNVTLICVWRTLSSVDYCPPNRGGRGMAYPKPNILGKFVPLLVIPLVLWCTYSTGCRKAPDVPESDRAQHSSANEAPEQGDAYFRELSELLTSEDPSKRDDAFVALYTSNDDRALEILIDALDHENSEVRHVAARALEEKADPGSVQALIGLMERETDSVIGWTASRAVGQMGKPALRPLLRALKHQDPTVRARAASAIGYIALGGANVKGAVKPLTKALKDTSAEVRAEAASALRYMGEKGTQDPLIVALQDEDVFVRADAATALREIGDARAVEPLIEALKDKDDLVRGSAALALWTLGDKRAVEPLIEVLNDAEPWVRATAAGALGALGDPRALQPLVAIMHDKDRDVRISVVEALGFLGDPRAAESLIAAMDDKKEDEFVRWSAAVSLGGIDSPSATDRLLKALRNRELDIVAAAYQFFIRRAIEGSEPILIEALHEHHRSLMADAFSTCGNEELEEAGKDWLERGMWGYCFPPGRSQLRWGSDKR